MNLLTKSIIATVGTLLLAMAPAVANAERVYFLVGVRHIYRIGLNRDANLQERIDIEKNYADGVAADRDTFQKNVDGGADATKESDLLNDDLDRLADERDKALGALFEREDGLRERHPELRIEGDGPYQVMGIEYHMHENVEVFEHFVVYAPWPGYVVIGRPYGGWAFGIEYGPTVFFNLYFGWHEHYYTGDRFYGGFYGHGGPVRFAPRGYISRPVYGSYVSRPAGGGRVSGYGSGRPGSYGRPGGGSTPVRTGGYGRSAGSTTTRSGGYGQPGSSSTGSGTTGTRTGGYSHSTGTSSYGLGSGNSGRGGYGRTGGSTTSTGSTGRGSSDTGATGGRSSGYGGYSNSRTGSGSSSTGTGRSTSGSSTGGYSRDNTSSRTRSGSNSGSTTGSSRSGSGSSHSGSGSSDKGKDKDKSKGN